MTYQRGGQEELAKDFMFPADCAARRCVLFAIGVRYLVPVTLPYQAACRSLLALEIVRFAITRRLKNMLPT